MTAVKSLASWRRVRLAAGMVRCCAGVLDGKVTCFDVGLACYKVMLLAASMGVSKDDSRWLMEEKKS